MSKVVAIMTTKRSNIYSKSNHILHSTPKGSNYLLYLIFNKQAIPSGLKTEIQNNLKVLRYE